MERVYQFLKFIAVGVINTLVTLVVIAMCKWGGMNLYVANAVGYVVGLINSFVWNRQWVFKAGAGNLKQQALKFASVFGICYALQFAVVWGLTEHSILGGMEWQLGGYVLSGYGVATLAGMGVYTISNFLLNRMLTFR